MAQNNNLTVPPIHISAGKRMVVGAGIGLLLISLFVVGVKNPNPAWGKLWMIRPLLIVPFAGAMGGLCNYFLIHFHDRISVNKPIAMLVSVFVFMIKLWLGSFLGLDGTLWD